MKVWITRALIGLLIGVPAQAVAMAEPIDVRVTYYTDRGVTYSGSQTRPGVAACSWNLGIGTTVRFPDGRTVVCEDRGLLGAVGWIDVWMGSLAEGREQIARRYGDWVTVDVQR